MTHRKGKGEVRVVKEYKWNRDRAPLILNLDSEVDGQIHASGGPQTRPGRSGEDKYILPLSGFEPIA
jgi:hypothetical protein